MAGRMRDPGPRAQQRLRDARGEGPPSGRPSVAEPTGDARPWPPPAAAGASVADSPELRATSADDDETSGHSTDAPTTNAPETYGPDGAGI